MSFLPAEKRRLEAEGWSTQRIAGLRAIVTMPMLARFYKDLAS